MQQCCLCVYTFVLTILYGISHTGINFDLATCPYKWYLHTYVPTSMFIDQSVLEMVSCDLLPPANSTLCIVLYTSAVQAKRILFIINCTMMVSIDGCPVIMSCNLSCILCIRISTINILPYCVTTIALVLFLVPLSGAIGLHDCVHTCNMPFECTCI